MFPWRAEVFIWTHTKDVQISWYRPWEENKNHNQTQNKQKYSLWSCCRKKISLPSTAQLCFSSAVLHRRGLCRYLVSLSCCSHTTTLLHNRAVGSDPTEQQLGGKSVALCSLSRTNYKTLQLGSCTQLFYHSLEDLPARELNHRYFVDTTAVALTLHIHHQDIKAAQILSQMHQTKWYWKLPSITNTALCLCFSLVLHKPHQRATISCIQNSNVV